MVYNFVKRLDTYLAPIGTISYASWASCAVCRDAVRSRGVRAFSEPSRLRDEAFAVFCRMINESFGACEDTTVVPDLVASAEGIILEPGPGSGNQVPLFDQAKVEHIFGVEINEFLIPDLRAAVAEYGLGAKYTIIRSGIEDTEVLESHGIRPISFDTIVSIQVLCSVAEPEAVMKELYRLLKPGGKLIFWEHTRSRDLATRIAQNFWTIPSKFFVGGCSMNRDILQIIKSAGVWDGIESINLDEEEPWDILPMVWGTLVKP
ncbi:S-adenosyl-L-methionine-dependent methyltransferase [Hypoxylon sp. FL1857]|nr:S-adenosyl-L-methionine-dependent methyltransferase [Hypoxylon sp. FL1857]